MKNLFLCLVFLSISAHASDECSRVLADRIEIAIHDLAKLRIDLDSQLAKGELNVVSNAMIKAFESKKKEILDYSTSSKLTEAELNQKVRNKVARLQGAIDSLQVEMDSVAEKQKAVAQEAVSEVVTLDGLRQGRSRESFHKISEHQFLIVGGEKNGQHFKPIAIFDSEKQKLEEVADLAYERYANVLSLSGTQLLIWGPHAMNSDIPAEIFNFKTKKSIALEHDFPFENAKEAWFMANGEVIQLKKNTGFQVFNLKSGVTQERGYLENFPSQAATQLPDGSLILSGGLDHNPQISIPSKRILKIDGTTFEVSEIGNMNVGRFEHAQVTLPDGTILICGGVSGWGKNREVSEIERFDPSTGQTTLIGHMLTPRHDHQLVYFPDNRVVILGGRVSGFSGISKSLSTIEVLDLDTNEVTYLDEVVKAARGGRNEFDAFLSGKNEVVIFSNVDDQAIEIIKTGRK